MNSLSAPWIIREDGALSADWNMEVDAEALEKMVRGETTAPVIRFFEWSEIAISYGYLMEESRVRGWANALRNAPIVKRPTGGGAVLHYPSDLSVSLLWPRGQNLLSDHPREAYGKIHSILLEGLEKFLKAKSLKLYSAPQSRFNQVVNPSPFQWDLPAVRVCFKEPVCHDVMMDEKKIVGGALRITKGAVLYQGNIQMAEKFDTAALKTILIQTFKKQFAID